MTFTLRVVVEHLPAWGLCDDRILGTDQAVRGGRHGQKLRSGFPPRRVDARGGADARSSTGACLSSQKVQGREANRRRHRQFNPISQLGLPPPSAPPLLPPHSGAFAHQVFFCIRHSVCLEVQPGLAQRIKMHLCLTVECITSGLHLSVCLIRSQNSVPRLPECTTYSVTRQQRLYPSNTRRCFRQFLVFDRCLDKRWGKGRTEVWGQQKRSNDPCNNQHNPNTPTTGRR